MLKNKKIYELSKDDIENIVYIRQKEKMFWTEW
jgi:hypothetical protein